MDEDWITAVTNAPDRTAVTRLVVSRERMAFIRPPATAFNEVES
jgi:hypothetical protein